MGMEMQPRKWSPEYNEEVYNKHKEHLNSYVEEVIDMLEESGTDPVHPEDLEELPMVSWLESMSEEEGRDYYVIHIGSYIIVDDIEEELEADILLDYIMGTVQQRMTNEK